MNFKITFLNVGILILISCNSNAQKVTNKVNIVGQMKDVMWKGQLYGTIYLDSIQNKTNLYGLGPVEYLTGEIIIVDGTAYKSIALSDTTMSVTEDFKISAPFFGYANISKWEEQVLPDSVQTIIELEEFLNNTTKLTSKPFIFKLWGTVEQATIHIVNLPQGSKVSSPDDAHKAQVNYQIENQLSEIIGFFSTEHKGIFTHHDTYLHIHLITTDRKKMGHLDKVLFKKDAMKLYFPAE